MAKARVDKKEKIDTQIFLIKYYYNQLKIMELF